ncbi:MULTISPECIES: LuxR C-terminal-related transcriptional regulator [Streptomyces]|uniref:response regulator transcription factor n=1 Tax=Streptomyces TaxID=1883 RepID=UPI0022AEBBA6|nr:MULTISPECIES: LuxR C-terminal-related transcriptional regulator [Streptomyces]MCZ4096464.1 LuxR C-terminal-related transcriptional regulator [Streptomyces sp. H39-C1]
MERTGTRSDRGPGSRPGPARPDPADPHLVRGHRNRAIAEDLHISESTVKFHVANILNKLDVDTRGEAAALARSGGTLRRLEGRFTRSTPNGPCT